MMEVPPNHLSQLLNEGFDKNFSEFVNSYRLETFKPKVADPSLQHLTILGLAYESSFNSKTVFNTFFKNDGEDAKGLLEGSGWVMVQVIFLFNWINLVK